MADVPRCAECDVPELVSQEQTWLNDGSIVQTRFRESRMVFVESENWDPIWSSIAKRIGLPIERIIIDACRRAVLGYMLQIVTDEVREMVRAGQFPLDVAFELTFNLVRTTGAADPSFVDVRFEHTLDDYIIIRYRNPFSVPLVVGMLAGTVESYTGRPSGVVYKRIPPDSIEVKVFEAEHPKELKGRLHLKAYHPVEGGIRLERCPACGAPAALSKYKWDIDAGLITSVTTGRRMSLAIAPQMIDAIFSELENELGEEIPRIAVDSQRRFVRNGPYMVSEITNEDDLRRELALRGLGELTNLKLGRKGANLTLEHSTMPLWVVGLAQGLFELVFGEESNPEWELGQDGRLEVSVTPSSSPQGG